MKNLTIGVVLSLLVLTGCDQIQKFMNNKKEQPVSVDSVAAPAPQPQAASGPMPANALARIGNWTITKEDFEERLKALKEVVPDYDFSSQEARKLVLEELIRQQLLLMDAEKNGMANTKEIRDAIDEFRRTLIVREVARAKTEKLAVTDEEAKEFYEKNKEILVEPLQLKVREIVVADKAKAESLLAQVLQGADFAQLAKDNSISKSAAKGGDLGMLSEPPFPQMASAIISLETGDTSAVFSGPEGFYIVKVEEKLGGQPLPFEKIKQEIIQNQLLIKQQQTILQYIDQLRQNTKVETNESLL